MEFFLQNLVVGGSPFPAPAPLRFAETYFC
jgi:hypothetical protein